MRTTRTSKTGAVCALLACALMAAAGAHANTERFCYLSGTGVCVVCDASHIGTGAGQFPECTATPANATERQICQWGPGTIRPNVCEANQHCATHVWMADGNRIQQAAATRIANTVQYAPVNGECSAYSGSQGSPTSARATSPQFGQQGSGQGSGTVSNRAERRESTGFTPAPPYKLEMHTAKGPASDGVPAPPTGMGEYKIRVLDDERHEPVYTISQALDSTRWQLSGADACGQETLSFCRWLADQETTRAYLFFDGVLAAYGDYMESDLPDLRMGFRVTGAEATESGLCVIDVDRPDDANDWISSRFSSLKQYDEWHIERHGQGDIDRDAESRLVIGFNRDPGPTYNTCYP